MHQHVRFLDITTSPSWSSCIRHEKVILIGHLVLHLWQIPSTECSKRCIYHEVSTLPIHIVSFSKISKYSELSFMAFISNIYWKCRKIVESNKEGLIPFRGEWISQSKTTGIYYHLTKCQCLKFQDLPNFLSLIS